MEQAEVLNTIVHSLLEERSLVDDPEWKSFAVLVSITPEAAEMTAYRYAGDGPGKPTPVRNTGFQLFRDLRDATATAAGDAWEICIIKIERDSRKGAANFVYGDEAQLWKVTPANAKRIAENLRPKHVDFIS